MSKTTIATERITQAVVDELNSWIENQVDENTLKDYNAVFIPTEFEGDTTGGVCVLVEHTYRIDDEDIHGYWIHDLISDFFACHKEMEVVVDPQCEFDDKIQEMYDDVYFTWSIRRVVEDK